MPRPQFIMIDGKAVCIVSAGGKSPRKSQKHKEIAAYQSAIAKERNLRNKLREAESDNKK